MFLIASRNMSVLVSDLAQLESIEGKFSMHKEMGRLWFQ